MLPGALVGLGNWLFRWRDLLFPAAFAATLLADHPRLPFGSLAADRAMDVLGVALVICGQLLRAAVIGIAYVPRAGCKGRVHADELVEHGLFAHCRNPLYVGNFLVFLGLFTVLNSPVGWLVGVPAVGLTYLAIVAAEERFLAEKFGVRYDDYCRRVDRFRISLRGLGETLRGARFDWWRVLAKEYGQIFTWSLALVLLLALEHPAHRGGDSIRENPSGWIVALGAVFAFYFVARFLKKTGRLRSR
ncbi:MAG: methyltransferase family protein [Candidatus Eiseniibacteriota bacterium]